MVFVQETENPARAKRAQGFDNFIRKIKLHGANLVSAARRASHRMWRVTPRGDAIFFKVL
jgi:hypothetical protein